AGTEARRTQRRTSPDGDPSSWRDTRLSIVFEQPAPGRTQVSVDADHHVARLDDGGRLLADLELELFGGVLGDRRHDDHTASEVDLDVRGRDAMLHTDDLALELVARTHPHGRWLLCRCVVRNAKTGAQWRRSGGCTKYTEKSRLRTMCHSAAALDSPSSIHAFARFQATMAQSSPNLRISTVAARSTGIGLVILRSIAPCSNLSAISLRGRTRSPPAPAALSPKARNLPRPGLGPVRSSARRARSPRRR